MAIINGTPDNDVLNGTPDKDDDLRIGGQR